MNAWRPWVLASILCSVSTVAPGNTLYSNGVPDFQSAFFSDFSDPAERQQASAFSLQKNSIIQDFHWWGAYGTGEGPPGTPLVDDFTIRVFDDQDMDGNPDSVPLFEFRQSVDAQIQRTLISTSPPDNTIFGFFVYRYDAVVTNTPVPAGDYFLSIVNASSDVNNNEAWLWATSDFAAGGAWERQGDPASTNPWTGPLTGQLAFTVTGIAEPSSVALALLGLVGIARTRRKG